MDQLSHWLAGKINPYEALVNRTDWTKVQSLLFYKAEDGTIKTDVAMVDGKTTTLEYK